MNVLFSKNNTRKIVEHPPVRESANPSGDGDGAPPRCCRLCSAENGLHYFGDTYQYEGVEVRYDRLMYDCFGVTVTPKDCMICDRCIRSLRSTERFRALVYAAFDKPHSAASSSSSLVVKAKTSNQYIEIIPVNVKPMKEKILEASRKNLVKKKCNSVEVKCRRTNVQCDICKQRYPMMMTTNEQKSYTCSRCKKFGDSRTSTCRRCNVMIPASLLKDHLQLHAIANLRANTRLNQYRKQAPANNIAAEKQKYPCNRCPKKYTVAKNLLTHLYEAHGVEIHDETSLNTKHCHEQNESQELSNKQCDKCFLLFKNQKNCNHGQEHTHAF